MGSFSLVINMSTSRTAPIKHILSLLKVLTQLLNLTDKTLFHLHFSSEKLSKHGSKEELVFVLLVQHQKNIIILVICLLYLKLKSDRFIILESFIYL